MNFAIYHFIKLEICVICQGDTKGVAKGDGSVKKDTVGGQPGPNAQVELGYYFICNILM